MAFWAPIIAAVGSSLISGAMSKRNAADQMDFQEQMSGTAHQREVQDLIAAGLNPMLSTRLGGASTPSGAMAQTPDFASAMSSAMQAQRVDAEIDKIKADTKVSESQEQLNKIVAFKTEADTRLALANATQAELGSEKTRYLQDNYKVWDLEAQILHSNSDIKQVERLKADNDWKTITYLNDTAEKLGYNTWEQAIQHKDFENRLTTYLRNELAVSKEVALSDFYKTPYGKEVAPYLSSASDLVGAVGGGLSIGKRLLGGMLK